MRDPNIHSFQRNLRLPCDLAENTLSRVDSPGVAHDWSHLLSVLFFFGKERAVVFGLWAGHGWTPSHSGILSFPRISSPFCFFVFWGSLCFPPTRQYIYIYTYIYIYIFWGPNSSLVSWWLGLVVWGFEPQLPLKVQTTKPKPPRGKASHFPELKFLVLFFFGMRGCIQFDSRKDSPFHSGTFPVDHQSVGSSFCHIWVTNLKPTSNHPKPTLRPPQST